MINFSNSKGPSGFQKSRLLFALDGTDFPKCLYKLLRVVKFYWLQFSRELRSFRSSFFLKVAERKIIRFELLGFFPPVAAVLHKEYNFSEITIKSVLIFHFLIRDLKTFFCIHTE